MGLNIFILVIFSVLYIKSLFPNYIILNDPIDDLDDLIFNPGSKDSPEDESLISIN
jgi:hypothetical protein